MQQVGPWIFHQTIRQSVRDTARATNFTIAQQHYTFIQRENNRALISTFLTIKKTRRAAHKFIKFVDLSRVGVSVISDIWALARAPDHQLNIHQIVT